MGQFKRPTGQYLIRSFQYTISYWYQKVIRKRLELTLSLFVLRVVTDYSDNALSLDNLALFAHRLNRRPNFHCYSFPAWINKNALKKGIICPSHKKTDLYYSISRFNTQQFFNKKSNIILPHLCNSGPCHPLLLYRVLYQIFRRAL